MEEAEKEKEIVGKVERLPGFLYYVDKEGNVWKCKMAHGGGHGRRKKGAKAKTTRLANLINKIKSN